MNSSRISIGELKQHCIDLANFKPSKINAMIESERLTLKHHTDRVITDALKGLDNFFEADADTDEKPTKNKYLHEVSDRTDTQSRIKIKMEQKNHKMLDIVLEEPENVDIARKYFNVWKEKAIKKKEANVQPANQLKEEQIDKFIQGLKAKRKEKVNKEAQNKLNSKTNSDRSSSRNSSTNSNSNSNSSKSEIYQNRYKAQRDIILMQKSKLLEQEQKIHELQFGKICEELKDSYDDSQNTIKSLLKKFSARTKIVTGVKIVEEPEEVQMKINKVPKIVRLMEQRAQDRELKRQIIQERKRLIDEEKKRFLEEQLEKKRIQDEEEKKLALDAIKERRRRDVAEEKRKQAEKDKFLRKCRMADKFYTKLLKKRAISRFKLAVQRRQYNENISIAFYETVLMRKCLHQWRINAREIQREKMENAVEHYETKLKIKVLNGLMAVRIKAKQNMQVAIDYHAYQLQCKVFKAYYLKVNAIKIRRYYLMNVAIRHYKTRILVQAFYQWKSLPAVLQLERAKEEKKRKWREKVLLVIPNYKPPELF